MPSGISQTASNSVRHVPILHFWDIGTPGGTFTQMTPAEFGDLLDSLDTQGYIPQKLSDYIKWMRGVIDLPRKSVVLVFSGGLSSHYSEVFPACVARNMRFNLTVPGSFIEHETELVPSGGAFYTTSQLREIVDSGLGEAHSEAYHLEWFFMGNAASIQPLYKAAQINLKWGGIGEKVDNYYSYAPLIGTNSSLAPVVTTYTFSALPRGYREGALIPTEIKAKYLAIDHLQHLGAVPGVLPTVNIEVKRHSDSTWTPLKTGWQPSWSVGWVVVMLDTTFTFLTGEAYDLKFTTGSAAAAYGELITLGSITASANSQDTKVNSNTSSGAVTNQTLGGDIYLLESLAAETYDETKARVLADAQENLDFLAPFLPASQLDVAYYYPYGTIGISQETIWLPSTVRTLHPFTFTFIPWLADRWSNIDLAAGERAVVPAGFPKLGLGFSLPMNASRGAANLVNQIGAFSGALWDESPDWTPFGMTLGWVNEWSTDYATERDKYLDAYTYVASTLVGFNTDGVSFPSADITKLEQFMALPCVKSAQSAKILIQIGHYSPQATTMHNVFSNAAASVQAMIDLLRDHAPTAAGFALNLEGATKTDRAIANAWIRELRQAVNQQLPGRIIIAYAPNKTSDSPDDDWSGWVEYRVWGENFDIVAIGFYAASDWQPSIVPGPTYDWTGMHTCLTYASSQIPQAKIMPGFAFYGTWRDGGPIWSTAKFEEFYSMLKVAWEHNATWAWDAAGHEWYWLSADATAMGYQPTPETFADYLAEWAALGYTKFFVWAIGQGDALMYPNAEEVTAIAPLLTLRSGAAQTISDLDGSSSIGQFDVEVLEGSAMGTSPLQSAMALEELHGKKARLKMGYAGIPAPRFPTFETFEVDRVDVGEDVTSWKLRLVDTKRSVRSRIFAKATEDVPVSLSGNPIDILLRIYQNELGIGQNPNLSADGWIMYDAGGAAGATGLINPNRYLDVPTLLAYRDGLFKNYYLEFTITEPQDAKQWIEREIYKALGGYSIVNAAGQLTPRFWLSPPVANPAGPTAVFDFTDHNLTRLPTVERAPIVNQLTFRLDHDGSEFGTVLFIVDGASFSRYGLQGQQVVESMGSRSARQGGMHAQLYASKLFRRYANITPVWTVEAFHQALAVEVGDLVSLTHPKAIDPVTNTRGIANVMCEVLEKHPQYDRGNVEFKLLDVRYLAGKKAYAVAYASMPIYSSNPFWIQESYMFTASDSTGLYSTGDVGNEIYG